MVHDVAAGRLFREKIFRMWLYQTTSYALRSVSQLSETGPGRVKSKSIFRRPRAICFLDQFVEWKLPLRPVECFAGKHKVQLVTSKGLELSNFSKMNQFCD